jgi:DsbC/DsbD-like thiol-disulfide interchange protein
MFMRGILLAAVFSGLIASEARAGHAYAELLANVSAIQAGKPFWLGVRLKMDDGWHVYWKNPGDAGLPTRVKFKLPDGFTAGPLQFPTPRPFAQPGNITIYGYEDSVMLLAQVTPPATLPADFQGQFSADVSWLVCAEQCIPGKATLNLTLGVSASAQPDNRELFDEWVGQLPVEASQTPEVASVNSTISGKTCTVTVDWAHAAAETVDFLPDSTDDFTIGAADVKSSQNSTVIAFTAQPLAGKNPGPTTLQVVLGYQNSAGKRRGIIIPVALPVESGNNNH